MKEVIEHLERMAETLDGVTEENWLDTPEDIAKIYRSVANEIKQKMAAKNQSVTNCNQLKMLEPVGEVIRKMGGCCSISITCGNCYKCEDVYLVPKRLITKLESVIPQGVQS